jgi:cyclopropane fatty-acyl-phospholipid synthase-like methyltransferase
MAISLDPLGHETAALFSLAGPLAGKTVLEIGCGDGRLTRRYAAAAARVVAIDPDREKVARAIQDMPGELREKVALRASGLSEYSQANPAGRFDLVLLSWSL